MQSLSDSDKSTADHGASGFHYSAAGLFTKPAPEAVSFPFRTASQQAAALWNIRENILSFIAFPDSIEWILT